MIVTILLPIFFLYFVLVSGYCAEILNCGLQKYMDSNIFVRHVLIFMSIYLFTFVLNWYTFESLKIQSLGELEEKPTKQKIATKQINLGKLYGWLKKTFLIYLIFLLSSKSEVKYIIYFFVYIAFGLVAQVLLKSFSTGQYKKINEKLIITNEDYNEENSELIIPLHNITSGGFILVILLLIYGSVKYYKRQYKAHRKNWSIIKFIFGRVYKGKECENV